MVVLLYILALTYCSFVFVYIHFMICQTVLSRSPWEYFTSKIASTIVYGLLVIFRGNNYFLRTKFCKNQFAFDRFEELAAW